MTEASTNYMEFLEKYKNFEVIDNPCQSYEFYNIYLNDCGKNKTFLFLYIYNENRELKGIVPLEKVKKRLGTIYYNFIGYRRTNYSGYICKKDDTEFIHAETKKFFLKSKKSVVINYYDINNTTQLYEILCKDKQASKKIELYYCPITTLSRDFDSFFKEKIKESKKRSELKKFEKKLGLIGNFRMVNIYDKSTYEKNKNYISQIYKVHKERFDNVYTPTHFSDLKRRNYYETLFKDMAYSGKLFLSFLLVDEDVISFIYCMRNNVALIDLIPAFDPAYSKYNLGTVHYKILFEYLCTSTDFNYFDFSKGISTYKMRWTDIDTANYQFLVTLNKNVLGSMYQKLEITYFSFKSILRKNGTIKKIKFFMGRFLKENTDKSDSRNNIFINTVSLPKKEFEEITPTKLRYSDIKFYSVDKRKQILNALYEGKKIQYKINKDNTEFYIYSQKKGAHGDE